MMTQFDEQLLPEPVEAEASPVEIGPRHLNRERRQTLIKDYAERHGGIWRPDGFYDEVASDSSHEARAWFEWDKEQAARAYNIERARSFGRGLQVVFTVETIDRGNVTVHVEHVPLVHSPMATRSHGGGYILTNPRDEIHMAALCQEAASTLTGWLNRYSAALKHCGGSPMVFQRQIRLLEKVEESDVA
jgi:hypothetical protein